MPPDNRLQTFGHVREISDETRQVTVVVSTGDEARDGAIIETSGWDLSHYEQNPVVLWAHDDRALPIARTVRTILGDHEMVQVHEFAAHPAAENVYQAVRGGFVNATSVRWIPGETEIRKLANPKRDVLVFTRGHQLLESSYVPIPADPGALVMRADGSPLDLSRMVIDYAYGCGVHGCSSIEMRGSMDLCDYHFEMAMSGAMPMPPEEEMAHSQPAPAPAAVVDSPAERLAAFAAHVRQTTQLLKGA